MVTNGSETGEQVSVSEQIERTSVNIITFSALSPDSGMPLNIPNILGGEDLIDDDVAKLKVEEAFGQLNIQSLFGFEEHMFQSCLYDTFHVGLDENEEEKLTPHIYLLKSHTNDVYLLNLLTTPYADLNLDAYFNEVEFMSRSFSGVFRRTNAQIDEGVIDEEDQLEIAKTTVDNLSGFMHFQIFTERGLREQVSDMFRKGTAMVLGMFFELSVDHTEHQCIGECGKTFDENDAQFEGKKDRSQCPECGGSLIKAPPILKIDNVKFVVPEGGSKHLREISPVHDSPRKYISYITGIAMPRNIALTTNRLSPQHFSTLAAIPSKAAFASPTDNEEYINLSINWRKRNDKIFMFCSVGNSKFAGRNELPFIPQITAATINRQIVEGFEKGKNLDQIVRSSIISDWVLSDAIDISDIANYESLGDLPVGGKSASPVDAAKYENRPLSEEIGDQKLDKEKSPTTDTSTSENIVEVTPPGTTLDPAPDNTNPTGQDDNLEYTDPSSKEEMPKTLTPLASDTAEKPEVQNEPSDIDKAVSVQDELDGIDEEANGLESEDIPVSKANVSTTAKNQQPTPTSVSSLQGKEKDPFEKHTGEAGTNDDHAMKSVDDNRTGTQKTLENVAPSTADTPKSVRKKESKTDIPSSGQTDIVEEMESELADPVTRPDEPADGKTANSTTNEKEGDH